MMPLLSRFTILSALILSMLVVSNVLPLHAQTRPKPAAPQPKPPAKTPVRPPVRTPAPAPAAAKPADLAPPPKPVAQDLRMKTMYTAADQKTESATYQKGARERFEFGDVVLLKQHDLKRTVQIMRAANMYMLVPDGGFPAAPVLAAAPNTPPQKPGVVMMTASITDTVGHGTD
jgi:hypothetical protein